MVTNTRQNQEIFSTIYFKLIYTSHVKYYNIYHDWTISYFINFVKSCIRRDLQIHSEIEIVEASSQSRFIGRNEDAPALEPEEISFKQKYLNNILSLAFYIRQINSIAIYPNLENQNIITFNELDNECMLCQEFTQTTNTTFGCQHQFCESCSNGCIRYQHFRCPICRHSI
jgi:hypothetical protein